MAGSKRGSLKERAEAAAVADMLLADIIASDASSAMMYDDSSGDDGEFERIEALITKRAKPDAEVMALQQRKLDLEEKKLELQAKKEEREAEERKAEREQRKAEREQAAERNRLMMELLGKLLGQRTR
jgi:hypothetical protein